MSGSKTPILLLTARDGVEDRVNGLDAGADQQYCNDDHPFTRRPALVQPPC